MDFFTTERTTLEEEADTAREKLKKRIDELSSQLSLERDQREKERRGDRERFDADRSILQSRLKEAERERGRTGELLEKKAEESTKAIASLQRQLEQEKRARERAEAR